MASFAGVPRTAPGDVTGGPFESGIYRFYDHLSVEKKARVGMARIQKYFSNGVAPMQGDESVTSTRLRSPFGSRSMDDHGFHAASHPPSTRIDNRLSFMGKNRCVAKDGSQADEVPPSLMGRYDSALESRLIRRAWPFFPTQSFRIVLRSNARGCQRLEGHLPGQRDSRALEPQEAWVVPLVVLVQPEVLESHLRDRTLVALRGATCHAPGIVLLEGPIDPHQPANRPAPLRTLR